eukprot:579852-Rhodomonas_salina.2
MRFLGVRSGDSTDYEDAERERNLEDDHRVLLTRGKGAGGRDRKEGEVQSHPSVLRSARG